MPKVELLEKYAKLIVEVGANVQKDQMVVVRSSTDTNEIARLIVKAAYHVGAKSVTVQWNDPYVSRSNFDGMKVELLEIVPQWTIDEAKFFVEQNGCIISIASPVPGLNKDVDPVKMQRAGIAQMKALKFAQDHMMGNRTQWNVVAAPNKVWAQKVFPNLSEDDAVEALWNAILEASRVTETNDPVKEWEEHNKRLLAHNTILNDYQFDTLHFKNSISSAIGCLTGNNLGGLSVIPKQIMVSFHERMVVTWVHFGILILLPLFL
ncbi:MAG: aminopeptidase, partial [Firmicutes bacterium]|nr:aminopeptidase [Bacillota bacterium]